jgi:hypothetical protein
MEEPGDVRPITYFYKPAANAEAGSSVHYYFIAI